MRRFRSFRRRGRRTKWLWIRQTVNNAVPSATLNTIDLMFNYRSHLGIQINLPDITIWRIRLKISIIITGAATVASNDGVLVTVFKDGLNQTVLSQLLNAYDEQDLIYEMLYVTETAKSSTDSTAAGTYVLFKELDIKTHRALRSVDDTLFLQLASSGQTNIVNYSYSMACLAKQGR